MKIIGLDVGEKRIGVAKVDSNTRIAVPVGYLLADGSEWQEIAKIARIQGTNWFVLGLPRNNSGVETRQTLYTRQFARTLTEKIPGARVRFQDESFTSIEAEERLKQRKKRYEKGEIDAEAAAIILQDFIEGFKGGADRDALGSNKEDKGFSEDTLRERSIEAEGSLGNRKKIIGIVLGAVVVLGLLGTTAVLKYRDFKRAEREEYYAELEAGMKAEVFNFTIRPGETIFDIKANLSAVGYSAEEIEEAFNAEYDFPFLSGRPEGASLEGYLFGETYEFYKSVTVKEILEKYLTKMGEVIAENNLEERYEARGLSLFEGITLASIVQKEAPGPEMGTVAQVFLSRLGYGWKLGSDVTVSYALDVEDPEREIYRDNAAALNINSCYNTRLFTGLPCGPIANPGLTALLAVAEPTDTGYLYFLTGDDGMMYYGYTEAEHNQNIRLHCKVLCNVSL